MLTILSSITNEKIGREGGTRISTLIMNKIIHMISIIMRQIDTCMIWIANHLTLVACFISYKKWVQREKCLNNTHPPRMKTNSIMKM